MPLKNDISHGVRRCNVVLTLEKQNKFMLTFAKVKILAEFLQSKGKKLEESLDFKCVFVVYCLFNRNRSALVHDLLSNNSLFVGQIYEDISLALLARDLIFFTTDRQTLNYSLPELNYFLINI